MKRKTTPSADPDVVLEVLDAEELADSAPKMTRAAKCVVCGSECAPNSQEDLCWVCRRLKISAWRDTDQQVGMQE